MAVTALDTHQTVKNLTAAGFTDAQAEAVTDALRRVQEIDLSDLATKADLTREVAGIRMEMATKADLAVLRAELEAKMADLKADILRWVFGISIAQAATIIAILKLFPSGHP
jgi:hypothetical protein